MKKFIIFLVLTLGFTFFAKSQIVESRLAENRTTVIEKVPGSDDRAILNDLEMNSFSLNEQVYIKDYSHKPMTAEKLETQSKQVSSRNAAPQMNAKVNISAAATTASVNASEDSPTVAGADDLSFDEDDYADLDTDIALENVVEVRRGTVNFTSTRSTKIAKRAAPAKAVKAAAPAKVETYRDIKMREARKEAEYRKNKSYREPVGEKVSRKRKRTPNWNADKRGKRSIFKCFKF